MADHNDPDNDPATIAEPAATEHRPHDDPADRGRLVIRDKVVQRISVQAALDTPGVQPYSAGLDKITGRTLPQARVYVAGNRARAELDIAVAWAESQPQIAKTVQRNVSEALNGCAGLHVDGVDVAIQAVLTGVEDGVEVAS